MIYYIVSNKDNIYDVLSDSTDSAYVGTNRELAVQAASVTYPYVWTIEVETRETMTVEVVKRTSEVKEF